MVFCSVVLSPPPLFSVVFCSEVLSPPPLFSVVFCSVVLSPPPLFSVVFCSEVSVSVLERSELAMVKVCWETVVTVWLVAVSLW